MASFLQLYIVPALTCCFGSHIISRKSIFLHKDLFWNIGLSFALSPATQICRRFAMSLRKHFKFSIFMISFMTDSTADLVQLLKSNSKKKRERGGWSGPIHATRISNWIRARAISRPFVWLSNLVWDARIVSTSNILFGWLWLVAGVDLLLILLVAGSWCWFDIRERHCWLTSQSESGLIWNTRIVRVLRTKVFLVRPIQFFARP